jgi:hypothetical protein
MNLTASSFVRGITYLFPPGSVLLPGEFIVLASDSNHFNSRYGFKPFGEYEGQLNNGGETIALIDAAEDTVFSFSYSDDPPWPAEADGGGYSLVARTTGGSGNPGNADYWTVSGNIHGSPGMDDIVSNIGISDMNYPVKFILSQNYPNPFNPSTTIEYSIPVNSIQYSVGGRSDKSFNQQSSQSKTDGRISVQLKVYDILGREVAILVNKQQQPGNYRISWDASEFSSGVYFYTLSAGEYVSTRKMLLVK